MKNGSKINLNISPNLIGNFNDKTNFSHKLSLTEIQVLKICKGFVNGSSLWNIQKYKISETQFSNMIQSGEIVADLHAAISQVMYLTGVKALKRGVKVFFALAKNAAPESAEKTIGYDVNKSINERNKKFTSSKASGITLTNNEIKCIIEVTKSLENWGIL